MTASNSRSQGTLQPPAQQGGESPRWVTIPVIHCRLHDGRDVTLLQASGYYMAGTPEDVTEEYQADFALDGGHVTEDCLAQVRVVLDCLMPWVNPPGAWCTRIPRTAPFHRRPGTNGHCRGRTRGRQDDPAPQRHLPPALQGFRARRPVVRL